ncbi:MAG: T9SS type A sorting domain-containing protein, partial [Bacteroidota bacterium]
LIPNSEVMITLYDVQGNLLVEQALWLDASGTYVGKGFQDLHLESGMYLLKATNNGKDLVRRLIVE